MDLPDPLDPNAPSTPAQPATGARITGAGAGAGDGPGPEVMAAATLDGNKVMSSDGQDLGKISDIMLDVRSGRIAYAVLTEGAILGIGGTLHAIPWRALTLDTDRKCFRLDATAEQVKSSPGFDKDHWPAMADRAWGASVHQFYHREPYWEATRGVVESDPAARIDPTTGI
ncbi:PRC-barrel domain-containing protein [Paraburkholderia sp. JPY419]|uniref:PRC-barrel domain-containing protein n=1 Tax=Paraburkholderia sp. JPY419 TaxID=667660 RepID=UPI003D1F8F4D